MTPLLSRTLGKHITVARTDGPPTIIDGDPAQLGQVLLNLCLNAADAMSGRGMVAISSEEVELSDGDIEKLTSGRYAKLSIADLIGVRVEDERVGGPGCRRGAKEIS